MVTVERESQDDWRELSPADANGTVNNMLVVAAKL
jgi:hypothetical protein